MYLLFVDESGTPPKLEWLGLSYFVIAGLVIPEDRWHGMRDKLDGLKRASAYRGEVKWRFFAPNNNDADNPMLGWEQVNRNLFREKVFFKLPPNLGKVAFAVLAFQPVGKHQGCQERSRQKGAGTSIVVDQRMKTERA